jgi:hypothetical protein
MVWAQIPSREQHNLIAQKSNSNTGNTSTIEAPFSWSGCGPVVYGARHKAKWFVLQCINDVRSNPVEGRTTFDSSTIWYLVIA